MPIEKNLWIRGGFYIDFDPMGQFRIIGPNNHLYCGLIDIPPHKIKIEKISEKNNVLQVVGYFKNKYLNLYYPAMDDMRTVRDTISKENIFSFLQIRNKHFDRLVPLQIKTKMEAKRKILIFRRNYQENLYYQTSFIFPDLKKCEKINKPFKGFELLAKTKKIQFIIEAKTNDLHPKKIKNFFLYQYKNFDFQKLGKYAKIIKRFWPRSEKEIEHLITWGKTSGVSFGTIFPRDWIETADLGIHDLRPEVREYIYQASLKNVSERGEAWHEDVVGEYKYEHEIAGKDIFDRHMIDIEPRYILGLKKLSENFLINKDNQKKLRRVAKYLIDQARKNDFITFKKLPDKLQTKENKYYSTGNWRDSDWAFKKIGSSIAPFDVNAVFYPEALKILKNFQKKLGLKIKDIDQLIKKWQGKKKCYLFKNPDGKTAYALAVYNIKKGQGELKFEKMKVNHLDESYLYTYGQATQEEIKSFCLRLNDSKYFYTLSGPLIIAKNNQYGYTPQEYHGLVIWPKQTAFVILGLSKHLKIAITENWPSSLQKLIKKTIITLCENSIKAFAKLKCMPELYWNNQEKPRLFFIQQKTIIQASKVQLWSSVAARRIFRKYYELKTNPIYKNI